MNARKRSVPKWASTRCNLTAFHCRADCERELTIGFVVPRTRQDKGSENCGHYRGDAFVERSSLLLIVPPDRRSKSKDACVIVFSPSILVKYTSVISASPSGHSLKISFMLHLFLSCGVMPPVW